MDSSFYLQQTQIPTVKQSSSASFGLWLSIISGTLLLGISFFLVWYYILREKYLPPADNNSSEQQSNQASSTSQVQLTLAPCEQGTSRATDNLSVETCNRCLRRQNFQSSSLDCSELESCKCKSATQTLPPSPTN